MLSFVYPYFLIGGIFIGIPVVIHLMKRQTAVKMVFPSIRFIIKGKLPREGKRKLRDIFLLLLRMLLFALIIFTLAGPEWQKATVEKHSAPAIVDKRIIIILDTSASMAGWGSFDKAKKEIENILQKEQDAEFALITSSNKPIIVSEPSKEKSSIIKKLSALSPTLLEGKHGDCIGKALELCKEGINNEIIIVSDFQLTDWSSGFNARLLSDRINLKLIDSSPERSANFAITDAFAKNAGNGSIEIEMEVQNFGIEEETRTATLSCASAELSRQITVPPRKRMKFAFPPVAEPEDKSAKITITHDKYTPDDTYHFNMESDLKKKIIAFAPLKAEPMKAQDLFYLAKVFAPMPGNESNYDFVYSDIENFASIEIETASVIFLLGAFHYLIENSFETLKSYMEKGGTVIATPGLTSSLSIPYLQYHGILSSEYQGVFNTKSVFTQPRISKISENTYLSTLFNEVEDSDIFVFPVYRYTRLAIKHPTESWITMTDGFPFLAVQENGKGFFYMFTVEFNLLFSDFTITNSFLPMMHEIASKSAYSQKRTSQKISIGHKFPDKFKTSNMKTKDGITVEGNAYTEKPGVYYDNSGMAVEVNVSLLESFPEKQSHSQIRNKIFQFSDRAERNTNVSIRNEAKNLKINLWPYFALAVFMVCIAEMLIANILDKTEVQ